MSDPSAPTPSVEAILHAVLPANVRGPHPCRRADLGHELARWGEADTGIYGDRVVVIPYVMPGFRLARLFAELFPRKRDSSTVGVVLMSHGMISFGESAQESYGRMIELVGLAEDYLARHKAWARTRTRLCTLASDPRRARRVPARDLGPDGSAAVVTTHGDPRSVGFAGRDDVAALTQQAPATPDHVLRTQRVPLLGRDRHPTARPMNLISGPGPAGRPRGRLF